MATRELLDRDIRPGRLFKVAIGRRFLVTGERDRHIAGGLMKVGVLFRIRQERQEVRDRFIFRLGPLLLVVIVVSWRHR